MVGLCHNLRVTHRLRLHLAWRNDVEVQQVAVMEENFVEYESKVDLSHLPCILG